MKQNANDTIGMQIHWKMKKSRKFTVGTIVLIGEKILSIVALSHDDRMLTCKVLEYSSDSPDGKDNFVEFDMNTEYCVATHTSLALPAWGARDTLKDKG
jgi:hypothetical protein